MSPEQIKAIKAKRDEDFLEGLRFLGGEGEEEEEVIEPTDERFDSVLASLFGCSVEELRASDKEK